MTTPMGFRPCTVCGEDFAWHNTGVDRCTRCYRELQRWTPNPAGYVSPVDLGTLLTTPPPVPEATTTPPKAPLRTKLSVNGKILGGIKRRKA